MEDPSNFPDAKVTSVIHSDQGSEGIMKMLGEANEAFSPLSYIKDNPISCKALIERVSIILHPSLYRAIKLTFLQDIRDIAHDGVITNEMATGHQQSGS